MWNEAEALLDDREGDFPNNLLKARDMFLKIAEDGGEKSGQAYTKLCEILFWLGEYLPVDEKKQKEIYFTEAVEHGKQAVEKDAQSGAAHMWYAATVGALGVQRGIMSSLASLGPIEKHGKKAMELDENYFHCAALRLLGRLYQQAPGWPIGPGDSKKAIQLLEKAVEKAPEFLFNQLYLAEAYIDKGRKDEARKLIDHVKAQPENPKFKMHYAMIQRDALAVEEKL